MSKNTVLIKKKAYFTLNKGIFCTTLKMQSATKRHSKDIK